MPILKSEKLTRSFLYDKDGEEIKLVDFNPQSTPEEIVKFYSGQYPELTNAKIEPEFEGNNVTFNISTSVGTKG
jgi:PRTRC genetic system protein C